MSHYQCSRICPKLPNFAKTCLKIINLRNFEIPPNIDLLVFLKNKKFYVKRMPLEHVPTVCIFNTRIFHMFFLLSKTGLYMWISAYPLVENDFFLNVSQLLWIWNFVDKYLTHLGTRFQRGSFHIYSKIWMLWSCK